jgi:hypothetical protein
MLQSAGAAPADVTAATAVSYALDDTLRLNHLQLGATHNSYHLQPALAFHASHRYSQPPLVEQLGQYGLRGFELDVHLSGQGKVQVYHIATIDESTSCSSFGGCLGELRQWSDTHRQHLPLIVWVEVKDFAGGARFDDLSRLDREIRAVFDERRLITPDFVQANHVSPRARVEAEGWPTLREVRGRVLFVLLNADRAERYTGGFRTLAGRAMFAVASPRQYRLPWALVTKRDDPTEHKAIRAALAAQLLVAANGCLTGQARGECDARLAAGLANGVHTLHADFPAAAGWRGSALQLNAGASARCNPITAPAECSYAALE